MDIGWIDAEQTGQRLMCPGNALRRGPYREAIAVPPSDRGMRFHRVVMLDRRDVGGVHLHRRIVERRIGIAATLNWVAARHCGNFFGA